MISNGGACFGPRRPRSCGSDDAIHGASSPLLAMIRRGLVHSPATLLAGGDVCLAGTRCSGRGTWRAQDAQWAQ